MIKCYWE